MNNGRQKADKKVVILGDSSVGKTCLIQRYINATFQEGTMHTIGCCCFSKQWGNKNISIWDTGGQERFKSLSNFYCRYAHAVIICYSLIDRLSFDDIDTVHAPLLSEVSENCVIVLVGTKLDLLNSTDKNSNIRAVLPEEVKAKSSEFVNKFNSLKHPKGKLPVFETSSKEDIQVNEVFEFVFDTLVSETCALSQPEAKNEAISLQTSRLDLTKKSKCATKCL